MCRQIMGAVVRFDFNDTPDALVIAVVKPPKP